MRDHRLTVAEWLLEAGAGRSAIHALGDLLGQRANELRRLAHDATLAPRTVYALVTLDDRLGAAVPLIPSPGRSRARDPELAAACDRALAVARAALGTPSLPALRFELEDWLAVFGASLGLPATLAFIGYYAPSRRPRHAVLATGRLLAGGVIAPVQGLEIKRAIAEAERGDKSILTPGVLSSIERAIAEVFGAAPLVPERHVLTLDQTIERARRARSGEALAPDSARVGSAPLARGETDRASAIADLEALALDDLSDSDRARVLLELGTLCRHAGESARAAALHREAKALLVAQRRLIGGDAAERYELECRLSAMDDFQIDASIAALSARLEAPFLNAHNEVRCRGMLAQALGMAGRHAEAVEVRRANVALQQGSQALRDVLPGTYCYLALDSAHAGDAPGFMAWAARLSESTPPGEDTQWRFNAAALTRGLVALGLAQQALDWLYDRTTLFDRRIPAPALRAITGDDPIATHPETSLLRAACRAHRRLGTPEAAAALAARVPIPEDASNLLGWLCVLVHLEARTRTPGEVQAELTRLHAPATQFHGDLLTGDLDAALDRVWY